MTGADDRKKEDFIMVFPLVKMNKEGTLLQPSYSYYSEEYAQRMCDLYLVLCQDLVQNKMRGSAS